MAEFRKWRIEFEDANNLVDRRHVGDPPGYDAAAARDTGASTAVAARDKGGLTLQKKQEALMSRATGQLKNVGMMAFMMWMSGSQIHLFSIMTTFSGLYQPIMAIVKSHEAFPEQDEKLDTLTPRIVFILIQLGGLAFALYRLAGMGLLPTHLSDFVSALSVPTPQEFSAGGVVAAAAGS